MAAAGNSNIDPSASSGLGGGPPVGGICTAPGTVGSATPPLLSTEGKMTDDHGSQCYNMVSGTVFSTKTCLELLPLLTPDQLAHEFNSFKTNDPVFAKTCADQIRNTRSVSSLGSSKMRQLVKNSLINTLCKNFDCLIQNYATLTNDFSFIAGKVNEYKEIIRQTDRLIPAAAIKTVTTTTALSDCETDEDRPTQPVAEPIPGNERLPEPVRILSDKIDIDFDHVRRSINFNTRVGSRDTAYFGNVGYTYAKISHKPQPYPNLPFFDTIFDSISKKDPTFTRENFSCLVTHYRDGNSVIAQHSDNEWNIDGGSMIYTLSLGETRKIEFLNYSGHVSPCSHDLVHGTVHEMSAESQKFWVHSIDREPHRNRPRISLTFRHMQPAPPPPSKPTVPPIKPPQSNDIAADLLTPTDSQGRKYKRILLLTDSIISSCPPSQFNIIGPYRCIKKFNSKLSDLDNFAPEFKYTDYVILAGGINDMSRYNWTAEGLADYVCRRLTQYIKRYPKTVFIINSLLWSSRGWLNEHVDRYNKYMHTFSRDHANVHFYDAHEVLSEKRHSLEKILATDTNLDKVNANGIHITIPAQRLMTFELVNFVGHLHARTNNVYTSKVYHWNPYLRAEFR